MGLSSSYIVDGSGHGPGKGARANSVAICMDALVNAEMRHHFGFNMAYPHGVDTAGSAAERALYQDLLYIFQALQVVVSRFEIAYDLYFD